LADEQSALSVQIWIIEECCASLLLEAQPSFSVHAQPKKQ